MVSQHKDLTSDDRNMPPYVSVKYMYIFSFWISFMLSIEIKNNLLGTTNPSTSFLLGRVPNKTKKNSFRSSNKLIDVFRTLYFYLWMESANDFPLLFQTFNRSFSKIHIFNSSGTLFIRRFCFCLAKPYSSIRWTSFWNNFVHVCL